MTSNMVIIGQRQCCPNPGEILNMVSALAKDDGKISRFSSFSGSIYDTAWLAMVYKKTGESQSNLLFPESLRYLLNSQEEEGLWCSSISQIDGVLSTLAALLALVTRKKFGAPHPDEDGTLSSSIQKAQTTLQSLLLEWNVDDTVHVGFEVLVPSLLHQLSLADIHFAFPGRERLMHHHTRKMKKFQPAFVYSTQTTLQHSLEAFVGQIDFDKVSHHCTEELGIFGSPAATAAYLTNASSWDPRAENYLQSVIDSRGGTGEVPSAYPSCVFELSWALSTLLPHATSSGYPEACELERLVSFFTKILDRQKGLIGFAPGILEDADDTARTLMTLKYLGKTLDPTQMVERFQKNDHFQTYDSEQNPSFSANCNVVLALLESEPSFMGHFSSHIEKATTFLLDAWETGKQTDKWNTSPYYSLMLLTQVLVEVLEKVHSGYIRDLPRELVLRRIPHVICQLVLRTLADQREDGSWANSIEVTSYCVLELAQCLTLPWKREIRDHLTNCFAQGRQFLTSQYPFSPRSEYLWIEKTSYKASFLEIVYCSSALYIEPCQRTWDQEISACFTSGDLYDWKIKKMLSALPLFKNSPLALIDLIFVEACRATKRLEEKRDVLIPRRELPMTEDKYLKFIPLIWIACNYQGKFALSSAMAWEMILLSMFNYQIDEFMESVVIHLTVSELRALVFSIKSRCGLEDSRSATVMAHKDPTSTKRQFNGEGKLSANQDENGNPQPDNYLLEDVARILGTFISYVLEHHSVLESPPRAQRELATEVHNFLLAHIAHIRDSSFLHEARKSESDGHMPPVSLRESYFKWVRGTASDDTSCPFAFQFFACLVSAPREHCFKNARAQYFSQSLCRHLATMCRQYNDYGSATRDAEECNLNSLDFSDFRGDSAEPGRDGTVKRDQREAPHCGALLPPDAAKSELMAIADFERSCMELALQRLDQVVQQPSIMGAFGVFVKVTDMFGQVYAQRDIASRVQQDF